MIDMFDTEKFAERLRVALARANVTAQELSKEIDVDPATLSRLRQGRNRPSAETQARIMAWLEKVEQR